MSTEAAMEDVEAGWSSEPYYTNIETRLSGQFIEITGEMEIPED